MTMLAERVDGVIGVDTHRDTLAAAAVSPIGAVLASTAAINQFKSLIVSAPDDLRAELRRLKRPAQISRCAQLRDRPTQGIEHRMTVRALRSTAQRVQALQAEAKELENEILNLVRQMAPELLDLQGAALSPQPRCWSAGRTLAASAPRLPSRPSPASHRSRPLQDSRTDTGSTAAVTAS